MNKIKFALSSIIVLLVYIFVYFVTYNFVEPRAYDFMVKNVLTEKLPFDNKKQIYGSGDIVLVVIDAKTVEKYRWPWKRELNCKIFEYFNQYTKAKVIVHDSLISSMDKEDINSDKKYFDTLNKFNNLVVGFMPNIKPWENIERGEIYDKRFSEKFSINVKNEYKKIPYLYSSVLTFPVMYFDSVKKIGSVSILPGFINGKLTKYSIDEVYRNQEYIIPYKGNFYPSLALGAFLISQNNPEIIVSENYIKIPKLNYNIKQRTSKYQSIVPIKYYKLWNGYSHPMISAVDIMDSYDNLKNGKKAIINPEIFKDKIIVIGANVPAGAGLNDNKNTPITTNHPGVDIQATTIDNIVHNDFLKIVPDFINFFLIVLGISLTYIFIRLYDLAKSTILTTTLLIAYLTLATLCFYFGIIINIITPITMFIITTIFGYTHKFILENRSKEKVKSAMGKYMSEDVMKRVISNIDNLGLGGKKANVTVLFSDIRGFTSMSETMSAQQVSEILNEYFTEMEPIITKYNGIINKFIGDAVMAIFGEPIQDKNHAQNAVRCGYEMLLKVKELQNKWIKEGKPKIEIGIGINTGDVFVGNIGSENRMEYTVIGDTVNLASRLESYNKVYKTKMLISSSTYQEVKGFVDSIKISDVEIRGKSHKMDIYEILKID